MVQIIRRTPNRPFHPLLAGDMDRLFGAFLPAVEGKAQSAFAADVDVQETDEALLVRAELPGMEPADLNVSVVDDVLTIEGEKRDDREEESEGWRLTERRFGSFRRQFALPAPVDGENVSAAAKNGVLTIRLPKAAAAKTRVIPVSTGD